MDVSSRVTARTLGPTQPVYFRGEFPQPSPVGQALPNRVQPAQVLVDDSRQTAVLVAQLAGVAPSLAVARTEPARISPKATTIPTVSGSPSSVTPATTATAGLR